MAKDSICNQGSDSYLFMDAIVMCGGIEENSARTFWRVEQSYLLNKLREGEKWE